MFLPESIDHDPSCQRVFSIDQPLGQAQAVAGSLCAQWWEHSRNIRRDFFLRLVIFPSMQHEGIAWFGALGKVANASVRGPEVIGCAGWGIWKSSGMVYDGFGDEFS